MTFQGKQKGICDEESDHTAKHKLHPWNADFLRAFLLFLFINETFVLIIYKPNKVVMMSHYKLSSDKAVNTTFILEDNTHV